MEAQTPSPVKAVQQYEADEAIAKKLQQEYDDAAQAQETQELLELDDEFDRVTQQVNEAKSEKLAQKLQD